ncbi:MAG TPA: hypothetical protein VJJ80_01185 [Patescibacteria group bacterium]|nr:hypothetical protein [Patescibacteria group bacterium]
MHALFLILHIVGAGVIIGVVVFSVLLNIKEGVSQERLKIFQMMRLTGTIAAGWLLATGLVLYFQEAEELKGNILFWIKMGLFVLDGIIAVLIIDRKIKKVPTPNLTVLTIINAIVLFAIVVLGKLI